VFFPGLPLPRQAHQHLSNILLSLVVAAVGLAAAAAVVQVDI
jgi:hypothetical protein